MKYIFVPISIVGCGKSTVFRTLTGISSRFAHIENDYFSSKRAFYDELQKLVHGEVPYILVDRNNHLHMHRQQLIELFKKHAVCFVALLFLPANMNKKVFDTNWKKMVKRGDNHPQLKSATNVGQVKMVLSLFIKNLDPYNPREKFDAQFDHVLDMRFGSESSRENVDKILDFVYQAESYGLVDALSRLADNSAANGLTRFTKEEIDAAFKKSLAFNVSPKETNIAKPAAGHQEVAQR